MRIQEDFQMYYNGTYIGYREEEGGPVLPFYIDNVEWDGDISHMFDEDGDMREDVYRSEEYNDYSPEAYASLVFCGHVIDATGNQNRSEFKSVRGFNDPRLVFENPRIGFFQDRRDRPNKIWGTYIPTRSVKKGLSQNRVNFSLSHYTAFKIFENYYEPQLKRDFCEDENGDIRYRCDVLVAIKEGDVILLNPIAKYLKRSLEELYPECQIMID